MGTIEMFFPRQVNQIENEYLRPVLKTFKTVSHLVADPDGKAFCCSKSIDELEEDGSTGAIQLIRKFENSPNEVGVPLIESLSRPNHYWYEMKETTVADLIATINYYKTLFIAKMRERSFVNQRHIRFTVVDDEVDLDLCHALMNSYIGLFYIEALGFGRALGALDLGSTTLEDTLYVLDPHALSADKIETIKNKFVPLWMEKF